MVKAIVGANWGDEGKGKITDLLAEQSDIVVRFQGGANAGHTIINEYGRFALHTLPSGVFYKHITNVIGNGVALDIRKLAEEITSLETAGVPAPNLIISERAQLLMPYHILQDTYEEERLGGHAFGSTKSGIAPFYSDKYAKIGIQVCDLFHEDRLRERLDQGVRSAVVIGASMVGIKLVELLHKRGISVTLADMAPHIFPTAALPEVAAEIEDRLTAQGISLYFSRPIEAIEGAENGLEVCLGGGQRLPCDIALLCIGTRANTQLADDGIRVGRGIVVNDRMETSAPGIYAAGDCCEGNNLLTGQTQIIGLWDNAARQGETAGANIAGVQPSASYPGNITHNITHFMDMDFIGLGDIRMQGERRTFPLPGRRGRVDLVVQNGRMVCVNILDQYRISGVLKHFLLKSLTEPGAELRPTALGRLEREHVPHALIDYLEGLN